MPYNIIVCLFFFCFDAGHTALFVFLYLSICTCIHSFVYLLYLLFHRSGKYVYKRGTTAVLHSEERKFEVVAQSTSKVGEEQMDL